MGRFKGILGVLFCAVVYAGAGGLFVVDNQPPRILDLYPPPDTIVALPHFSFGVDAADYESGIWLDYDQSLGMWSAAECGFIPATYITWSVNNQGFSDTVYGAYSAEADFPPDAAVDVCVHIVDRILNYGCSCCPNYADTCWTFYVMRYEMCSRQPNPFTPNGDGVNDYCQFMFPGLGVRDATIKIYDVRNVLVRTLEVARGRKAKEDSRWDGRDNAGNPVPQGVYLYVIESEGEILCDGTVTVAR